MNSFNHWAFGAVGEWMWRHIVGLNPDEAHPGWKHFLIAPRPGGGLTWARGEYDSIRGGISSSWRTGDQKLMLEVSVPANTTATVALPSGDATRVLESGKPASQAEGVKVLRTEQGRTWFEIHSGRYQVTSPSPSS